MSLLDQLVNGLQVARLTNYLNGAALVIYAYEYFLTLDQEVDLVWFAAWTPVKVAFLVNRYIVIPNIVIEQFLLGNVNWRGGVASCRALAMLDMTLIIIGTYISEVILCLRFWLLWNNDKRLITGTLVALLGSGVYFVYINEKKIINGQFTESAVPGCAFVPGTQNIYIEFVILLIYDLGMLVLSLIPVIQIHKSRVYLPLGGLLKDFSRECFIFYVFTSVFSLVTLFLVIHSSDIAIMVVPLTRIIRVVLASRMVIHIRQAYKNKNTIMTFGSSTTRLTHEDNSTMGTVIGRGK